MILFYLIFRKGFQNQTCDFHWYICHFVTRSFFSSNAATKIIFNNKWIVKPIEKYLCYIRQLNENALSSWVSKDLLELGITVWRHPGKKSYSEKSIKHTNIFTGWQNLAILIFTKQIISNETWFPQTDICFYIKFS